MSDHRRQLENLAASGVYAVPLPGDGDSPLVHGLPVYLFCDQGERGEVAALRLAESGPSRLVALIRGRGVQVML